MLRKSEHYIQKEGDRNNYKNNILFKLYNQPLYKLVEDDEIMFFLKYIDLLSI